MATNLGGEISLFRAFFHLLDLDVQLVELLELLSGRSGISSQRSCPLGHLYFILSVVVSCPTLGQFLDKF